MYDESNKSTTVYNPTRHGDFGGGARKQQKTEVLMPKGPKLVAMLVGVDGPPSIAGQIFRLDVFEGTTIGRDYTCDIIIDEPAVSRQHAKVKLDEVEPGRYRFFIQDLATENGTVVNGQPTVKHYLAEDDRITLGRATLVFKLVDATQAGK